MPDLRSLTSRQPLQIIHARSPQREEEESDDEDESQIPIIAKGDSEVGGGSGSGNGQNAMNEENVADEGIAQISSGAQDMHVDVGGATALHDAEVGGGSDNGQDAMNGEKVADERGSGYVVGATVDHHANGTTGEGPEIRKRVLDAEVGLDLNISKGDSATWVANQDGRGTETQKNDDDPNKSEGAIGATQKEQEVADQETDVTLTDSSSKSIENHERSGKDDRGMDVDHDSSTLARLSDSEGEDRVTRSSARKRKTPPPPPKPNDGGRRQPLKKMKKKQMPECKPKEQSKLKQQSQESHIPMLNYFEEIETRGGSRLVDMYDLTQVMVCLSTFPANLGIAELTSQKEPAEPDIEKRTEVSNSRLVQSKELVLISHREKLRVHQSSSMVLEEKPFYIRLPSM